MPLRKKIGLILGPALFALLFFLPSLTGLESEPRAGACRYGLVMVSFMVDYRSPCFPCGFRAATALMMLPIALALIKEVKDKDFFDEVSLNRFAKGFF